MNAFYFAINLAKQRIGCSSLTTHWSRIRDPWTDPQSEADCVFIQADGCPKIAWVRHKGYQNTVKYETPVLEYAITVLDVKLKVVCNLVIFQDRPVFSHII